MVATLEGKLSRGQLRIRAELFDKARKWILAAGKAGGVGPTSKSWRHPDSKDVRVDIEVIKGKAFILIY
jgi:hypothetical protein